MMMLDNVLPDADESIYRRVCDVYQHLRSCFQSLSHLVNTPSTIAENVIGSNTRSVLTGCSGRPKLLFSLEMIEFMVEAGYTRTELCQSLGISRCTLWRRLKENNVVIEQFTDISDQDLDEIVAAIKSDHPRYGISLTLGHLLSIVSEYEYQGEEFVNVCSALTQLVLSTDGSRSSGEGCIGCLDQTHCGT